MQAPTEAPPTTVDPLEVVAVPDVRLSIAPGGDMNLETYVTSAPAGLTCGGVHYQYSRDNNRQCWLWVRRNSEVMLTAQSNGGYGTDWSVEWVGCQPVGNGAGCVLTPKSETEVAALFTRPAKK